MNQLSLSEETFIAVIAMELLSFAVLHVSQLFVDRVELHLAKAACDLEVRKDLRMKVTEVVPKGKRWNSIEHSQVEGTDKRCGVEQHQMLLAFLL